MHILIAVEESPHTQATLSVAAYLLQAGLTDEDPVLLAVARREEDRPAAERALAAGRRSLSRPQIRGKIRTGRPDQEILYEADRGRYDLIVVGEGWRARRPVARGQQRLTATRVAERAPCPVLVPLNEVRPLDPTHPRRRILLCDSGARSALTAAGVDGPPPSRFAARLAELLDGEEEVTVLHVMSQLGAGPGVRGKQLRAGADELVAENSPEGALIEQEVESLTRPGIHPEAKIRHGLVVEEIVAEARSGDYDLVIIGAREAKGWQRLLLDNLAQQILQDIDRTLLIVR